MQFDIWLKVDNGTRWLLFLSDFNQDLEMRLLFFFFPANNIKKVSLATRINDPIHKV